jgi:nicotinic acid phosphoribosyltransferase
MLKLVKGDFNVIVLGPEFLSCQTQTALGMVYKLMDFNNSPCIKFSEEKAKRTIPGFKKTIRLLNGKKFE